MQSIWAPWRAEYIYQTRKPAGCIFCLLSSQRDAAGNPSDDQRNHVLLRDRTCFALLNAYPYTGGHLMVAPYRHTGEMDELSEDELRDLFVLLRRCRNILRKAFQPDGFNLGMNLGRVAGAGIADHLHLHLVPRWNGDCNFMTVVGDLRVVSEGLDQTYRKLLEVIQAT